MRKTILFLFFGLFFSLPLSAQSAEGFQPYRWEGGDLALAIPAGWTAGTATENGVPYVTFRSGQPGEVFHIRLLPATTSEAGAFDTFAQALEQFSLGGFDYRQQEWFGQAGYSMFVYGGMSGQSVGGIIGRLPDARYIIAFGVEPAFSRILNSIAFSASVPPNSEVYSLIWNSPLPEPPESPFETPAPRITGIVSANGQVFAVDAARGVVAFDSTSGRLVGAYPFPNPSTPNGIAVMPNGEIIVGDTVCRCLQRLNASRQWGDTFGAFGGNAPYSLTATPDGTIYAVDSTSDGYVLRVFSGNSEHVIPLNFNASAPPLLAVSSDRVIVIEWLRSLIDEQINGAVSVIEDDVPQLQYWLPFSPDEIVSAALSQHGDLALALADGRVMLSDTAGNLNELLAETPPARLLAFDEDDLYLARSDGTVAARSLTISPERRGGTDLQPDIPVQGTISDLIPQQRWTFSGESGQVVTISATDLQRRNTLDMALRVLSPGGGEIAYNDDQLGVDLYGIFDAQIPDLVLPESGNYTVIVERVAGSGTYTLGFTPDRRFALEDRGVILTGALEDVFPVQRWVFTGQRGQIVTFTMTATSGSLDPALELVLSDGRTLAYNDDGADPELGTNAQLFRITLPRDGDYILEASRYDGAGDYEIVAVVNN